MQTPPDSEPEVGYQNQDNQDENLERGTATAPHASRRRPGDTAKTISGRATTSNRDKALVRRQRAAQRNIRTPDSFKDEPLVLHKPSSAATRLRSELVFMMEKTKRVGTWFSLVPSRLGHSEAVDSAAKSIVKAVEHASLNTTMTQDSCLGSYGNAITALRDDMAKSVSGDDLLLTVALLVTFERVFAYSSVPLRSHMHGVVAILMGQAKSSTKPPSELTRAVHYQFWPITFIGPCVMGTPSPFESQRWLDAEPVMLAEDDMSAPWKVVLRLKKMSNQLFIRLPRLIMLVKGLQTNYDAEQVDVVVKLAKELLEIGDTELENEMLHHVQIQKTEDEAAASTTPYQMNFKTIPEFEGVAHYWSTHILLSRLCWRLLARFPTKCSKLDLRPKQELQATVARMAANILMICQWGLTKGEAGESCLILCLVSVWGALNDFDVFAARSLTPAKARDILRQHGQKIMRDNLNECGQRLEAASELFAGGQSSGVLAFTFKKPSPG